MNKGIKDQLKEASDEVSEIWSELSKLDRETEKKRKDLAQRLNMAQMKLAVALSLLEKDKEPVGC